MKIIFCTIFILFVFAQMPICSSAQSRLRISLLTCTPGQELSETFGHSAFRVIDSNAVTDIVYNYGTFPFYEDGFYIKFVRGRLKYSVEVESFNEFVANYKSQNRGITEQVIKFSIAEKLEVNKMLKENIKEQNKYYQYDFFLDNCTTRLRDILEKFHTPKPILPAVMPIRYSFRNAIHQYLDANNQPWSKLGIDILLGAKTDTKMTAAQQMFLPENLMYALDSTKNTSILDASISMVKPTPLIERKNFFTPIFFSISLFVMFVLLHFFSSIFSKKLLHILDAALFFTIGLLGILLLFMWIGTNHNMTKDNYNLLWANPLFLILAYTLNKVSVKTKRFSLFACIYLLLIACSWFFLPQLMNIALLPIVLLMAWRSGNKYFI